MVLCLGEPPGDFCDTGCCSSFIPVFVMLVFKFPGYFYHATDTPPWLLSPMTASTGSELYPGYFRLLFHFRLPRALRFWVGIFYLQVFFTFRSFPTFLPQHVFIKASLGAGRFFLEVCRASCWSSKHRPDPSACLIHSNPESWYSEEFVFKSYQIVSWITCSKKFSLSAPYSFRTLFACLKSYVKTIENTLNKTCTNYNRFDKTALQSYFEKVATRKSGKLNLK